MSIIIFACIFAVIAVGSAIIWRPDPSTQTEVPEEEEEMLEMNLELPQNLYYGKVELDGWREKDTELKR